MKSKKDILFTFDYELFLGPKSGSALNCIIEPTEKLLALFEEFGVKHAIFFVDTTYLLQLNEKNNPSCKSDLLLIENQLRDIVKRGHYVFPHIHPHWLDAKYIEDSNQWQLNDYSKYRFHTISYNEKTELFDRSIELLYSILKPANPEYKITGYRAGGWCIQPFEDFKAFFLKHNITSEFSVIRGSRNLTKAQHFDFRSAPNEETYLFSNDVCVKDQSGQFREYCISTVPVSKSLFWINKFYSKYLWYMGHRSSGDGQGISLREEDLKSGNMNIHKAVLDRTEMVSIELLNGMKLPLYKEHLRKSSYTHFISHPKMMSEHNLKCFRRFIKYAINNFEIQTDFAKVGTDAIDLTAPENILFIAYQFAPMGGPGVQRSVQFVKHLKKYNYNPIVFTILEEDIVKMDADVDFTLNRFIPENTKIIRTKSNQPAKLVNFLTEIKIFRFFWYFFYPLFWERSALWPLVNFKTAKKVVDREKIKIIYTSSAPYSSLILGYLLKKRLAVKWVADLRDPFTDAYAWTFPSKIHWYFAKIVEKWILKKPDILIVNTPEVKKLYLNKFKIDEDKIKVITNGF